MEFKTILTGIEEQKVPAPRLFGLFGEGDWVLLKILK
jgi:hypothetical protein